MLGVGLLLPGLVLAADSPPRPAGTDLSDVIRSIDPNKFLLDRGMPYQQSPKPLLEPRIPFLPPPPADETLSIYVKTFKFSHNSVFEDEVLLSKIADYQDKELNLKELQEAAAIITRHYREQGYFVARAYIPAQTMEEETLEIAVLEGRHGKFELDNNSHVKDKTALGFLNYLQPGDLVSTQGLERQLLLIDDLSGAKVTSADVFPGENTGESDFKVGLAKTKKYVGYATLDNYGTRYTGEHRLGVGFNINSLTGIGDTLSFSGSISQTTDLKSLGVNYSRPLGYRGWTGGVGVSSTDYELAKLEGFEVLGTSLGLNAFASYPLIKSHSITRTVRAATSIQKMEDTMGFEEAKETAEKKNINLVVSLSEQRPTRLFSLPGSFLGSLSYTLGSLSLDNDIAKVADLLPKTEGFYNKLTLDLGHQQYLARKWTLQTSARLQQNLGDNLDGSEKISVAGSNGVRAYEDSELSGDSGYSLSLDLIYSLPQFQAYAHNVSVFLDHASVKRNTKTFNEEKNTRTLNAVGLGYAFNYKSFDLKATYGFGFGSEKDPTVEREFSTKANKFLFQAIWRF